MGNDQLNPIQEEPVENKDPLWLTLVVNIILIVPPARLVGEWSMSSSKNYSFDLLEFLTPQLENGLSWLTLLWPVALVYWLVKRNKNTAKSLTQFKKSFNDGQPRPSDFGGLIIFFLLIFVLIWFVEA